MNAHTKFETGRMTSKGQVLIPKAVREAIGLAPNELYKIVVDDKRHAVVSPIDSGPQDSDERRRHALKVLESMRGVSKLGVTTDEYMHEIRGD